MFSSYEIWKKISDKIKLIEEKIPAYVACIYPNMEQADSEKIKSLEEKSKQSMKKIEIEFSVEMEHLFCDEQTSLKQAIKQTNDKITALNKLHCLACGSDSVSKFIAIRALSVNRRLMALQPFVTNCAINVTCPRSHKVTYFFHSIKSLSIIQEALKNILKLISVLEGLPLSAPQRANYDRYCGRLNAGRNLFLNMQQDVASKQETLHCNFYRLKGIMNQFIDDALRFGSQNDIEPAAAFQIQLAAIVDVKNKQVDYCFPIKDYDENRHLGDARSQAYFDATKSRRDSNEQDFAKIICKVTELYESESFLNLSIHDQYLINHQDPEVQKGILKFLSQAPQKDLNLSSEQMSTIIEILATYPMLLDFKNPIRLARILTSIYRNTLIGWLSLLQAADLLQDINKLETNPFFSLLTNHNILTNVQSQNPDHIKFTPIVWQQIFTICNYYGKRRDLNSTSELFEAEVIVKTLMERTRKFKTERDPRNEFLPFNIIEPILWAYPIFMATDFNLDSRESHFIIFDSILSQIPDHLLSEAWQIIYHRIAVCVAANIQDKNQIIGYIRVEIDQLLRGPVQSSKPEAPLIGGTQSAHLSSVKKATDNYSLYLKKKYGRYLENNQKNLNTRKTMFQKFQCWLDKNSVKINLTELENGFHFYNPVSELHTRELLYLLLLHIQDPKSGIKSQDGFAAIEQSFYDILNAYPQRKEGASTRACSEGEYRILANTLVGIDPAAQEATIITIEHALGKWPRLLKENCKRYLDQLDPEQLKLLREKDKPHGKICKEIWEKIFLKTTEEMWSEFSKLDEKNRETLEETMDDKDLTLDVIEECLTEWLSFSPKKNKTLVYSKTAMFSSPSTENIKQQEHEERKLLVYSRSI
jgi:hypothetical protein